MGLSGDGDSQQHVKSKFEDERPPQMPKSQTTHPSSHREFKKHLFLLRSKGIAILGSFVYRFLNRGPTFVRNLYMEIS